MEYTCAVLCLQNKSFLTTDSPHQTEDFLNKALPMSDVSQKTQTKNVPIRYSPQIIYE